MNELCELAKAGRYGFRSRLTTDADFWMAARLLRREQRLLRPPDTIAAAKQ
jgi:hypothetical protein